MDTDDTTDPGERRSTADHGRITRYEIRVVGHLAERWAAWFDGMAITNEDDGTTAISGPVVDQAALHGVLQKLRDLGIGLRSLTQLEPGTELERHTDQPPHDVPGATP